MMESGPPPEARGVGEALTGPRSSDARVPVAEILQRHVRSIEEAGRAERLHEPLGDAASIGLDNAVPFQALADIERRGGQAVEVLAAIAENSSGSSAQLLGMDAFKGTDSARFNLTLRELTNLGLISSTRTFRREDWQITPFGEETLAAVNHLLREQTPEEGGSRA